MNRQSVSISLENQTASTCWVVRVVFHHNGRINSFDTIADLHVVFRRRLVAVERDSHFVMRHQSSDVFKRCAQPNKSFSRLLPKCRRALAVIWRPRAVRSR